MWKKHGLIAAKSNRELNSAIDHDLALTKETDYPTHLSFWSYGFSCPESWNSRTVRNHFSPGVYPALASLKKSEIIDFDRALLDTTEFSQNSV